MALVKIKEAYAKDWGIEASQVAVTPHKSVSTNRDEPESMVKACRMFQPLSSHQKSPPTLNTLPEPAADDVINISPTDAVAAATLEAIRKACSTPPPFPTLSRWKMVSDTDLIPFGNSAFAFYEDGVTARGDGTMGRHSAGTQAKSRLVRSLIKAINKCSEPYNKKQVVVALRTVSCHPRMRRLFKSAGLIDVQEAVTDKYIVDQIANS